MLTILHFYHLTIFHLNKGVVSALDCPFLFSGKFLDNPAIIVRPRPEGNHGTPLGADSVAQRGPSQY